MQKSPLAAVIGALNLDLVIHGLPRFAEAGEQVNGTSLSVSPGGKGRNIASMLSAWLEPGQVSMISKLVMDPYGLYKIPIQSLTNSGINTTFVNLEAGSSGDCPTIAIFLNTIDQKRASYYLPGENENLSAEDLSRASGLFQKLAKNDGVLLLTLEMPLTTAVYALSLAEELGLRVMLDPGGQPPDDSVDYSPLFSHPIYLLKPNEQEASRITGVPVTNFSTAWKAADWFQDKGVEHVVITHGPHGGYAFSGDEGRHIPAPDLPDSPYGESTGCGDQVLAVLCAQMLSGERFFDSCSRAILAGSLQYLQPGLAPIKPDHPLLN